MKDAILGAGGKKRSPNRLIVDDATVESSGEAETYGGASGVSVGMLMLSVLKLFEFDVGTPKLRMDSMLSSVVA